MTGFIDMNRTYEALSDEMKRRIEGLNVIQSWRFAQESIAKNPSFRTDEGAKMLDLDRFPDLACPIARPHPVTGKMCLNTPRMWSPGIVEMPGGEGDALLAELIAHTVSPEFVYWHSYQPGDLVVWDNWRMIHAASGTKGRYRRTMYRTILKGGPALQWPLDPEEKKAADERYAKATAAAE
jgi:taurine dioxygenase